MAQVTVRLRNEANTATLSELPGAFNIEYQVLRNDVGSGEFTLDFNDAQRSLVQRGAVVQFLLDDIPRFVGRVISDRIVEVSEGAEHAEATTFICTGILSDWELAVVQVSDVPACDLVPSLDERIWNWASGEYDPAYDAWPLATAIAGQGWGSPYYTGQPAGWTDSAAFYLWSSSGSAIDAPAGRCLFRDIFLVDAGKKLLEWACDNVGDLYVNGKKVQSGQDYRKKQVYEFETTAGFLTLAWDVVNVDDPGDNPGALIASLRENSETGDIIWRTAASGPPPFNALTMKVLEYPVAYPETPCGRIIRLAAEQNPIIDSDWNWSFTDTTDSNSATFPTIPDISFRLYDDSMLAVLKSLAETWIDFRVSGVADEKLLHVYAKGTDSTAVTLPLVTGYSTVGQANPAAVNVAELSWQVDPPRFDRLAVRWADGWIELGDPADGRWGVLRVEQINDVTTATTLGEALLALYETEQATATFSYEPLVEPDHLPFVAFNVHDTWAIPGPVDHDTTTEQTVQGITVRGGESGEATYVIEVGSPREDEITLLERSINRVGPGALSGLAAAASASAGKAPYHSALKIRATSPTAGAPVHCIASNPGGLVGVSIAPNLFVGLVTNLRLIGQGGTSTSTVEVSDGPNTWTLSGTGEGVIDVEADINEVWSTANILTVDFITVGHEQLHVFADVAEVS